MGQGKDPQSEVLHGVRTPWHSLTTEDGIKEMGFKANLKDTGLSGKDADDRLQRFGFNKMTEAKKKTLWERIWEQVANVLVAIIVFVAVLPAVRAATCPPPNLDDPEDPNKYCVVINTI
jgi:magnesium-transporting ATPase (P-type)